MQFENLEATYLEYILDISPNVDFEVHGYLCNKDPPSSTYLVSTGKASTPHSPDFQIASARVLLCASRDIPELSNREEG